MKKILLAILVTFFLMLPIVVKAADIGLKTEVKLVNEPSTYYTWLTVNNLPNTATFKAYRDGTAFDAKFALNKNNNTYLGSDTYPPEGSHTYKVVIYDSSNKSLGEGTTTVTVPSGSYVPPKEESSSAAQLNIADLGTITFWPTKVDNLGELITVIINWMLGLMGAFAVVAVVYSGVMYITASNDPAKAETAKKNLTWAI
ncbi:hypothetical protein A2V71_03985, partial [Candidatus Berkelbacteria bacterium RBG_13_40_8]